MSARKTVTVDFETRSAADLKAEGAIKYAKHPSTDIWCLAWAYEDGPVHLWGNGHPEGKREIAELMDLLELVERREVTIIAHNAPFELAIWNHVCVPKYGWPVLHPEDTMCTMAMAYAMAIPASLEKCAAALGLTQQKDMAGNRVMLQLSQPRDVLPDGTIVWWDDPDKIKRVFDYCRQDIEVERAVEKRLFKLSPREMEIWLLDFTINNRGVQVDLPAAQAAIEVVEIESARLDQAMREVTGGQVASCKAVAQLVRWLQGRGVEVDSVAKADILNLLDRIDLPRDVVTALHLRQEGAKSSTAKLEAFINGACPDGRMRGLFQYHGAGTGRWAGRRAQLQNMPRPNLKQSDINRVFELLGEI